MFLSLHLQLPALDPQIDTELQAPVPKPADWRRVVPTTQAALCPLSKAGLACFKFSVAFCPDLAELGRGRQRHRKGAVRTMRGGHDISQKPPGLEVLLFPRVGKTFFHPGGE